MLMMRRKHIFFLHNSRQIRASGCLYRYLARKEQCLTFDPIYYPSFIRTHKKHKDGLVLQFFNYQYWLVYCPQSIMDDDCVGR